MMGENEEANSYAFTADCDIHHGWTVVLAASAFFCSFFLPQPWQLWGICGDQSMLN